MPYISFVSCFSPLILCHGHFSISLNNVKDPIVSFYMASCGMLNTRIILIFCCCNWGCDRKPYLTQLSFFPWGHQRVTFCIKDLSIIKLLIYATKVALGGSSLANNKSSNCNESGAPETWDVSHSLAHGPGCLAFTGSSLPGNWKSIIYLFHVFLTWVWAGKMEGHRRWQGGREDKVWLGGL